MNIDLTRPALIPQLWLSGTMYHCRPQLTKWQSIASTTTIQIISSGPPFSFSCSLCATADIKAKTPFNGMLYRKAFSYDEYFERCNMFQTDLQAASIMAKTLHSCTLSHFFLVQERASISSVRRYFSHNRPTASNGEGCLISAAQRKNYSVWRE